MLIEHNGVPVDDDLVVVPLTADSWRVTDRRFAADGQGLLAYVERCDGRMTVSIFAPAPVTDLAADCWETALAVLSRRSHLDG